MERRKILSLIMGILLVTSIVPFYAVFGYNTINLPTSFKAEIPDNQICHHSSGKFIYVVADLTAQTIKQYVYNPSGSIYSTIETALPSPLYTLTSLSFSVAELNSTATIIFVTLHSHYNIYVFYVKSYVITSSITNGFSSISNVNSEYHTSSLDRYTYHQLSKIIKYGDNYYCFDNSYCGAGDFGHSRIKVFKYITATNTISYTFYYDYSVGTSETIPTQIQIYQNPNSTKDIYLATSVPPDITLMEYFYFDLDAATTELLANHPASGRYYPNRKTKLIGAGLEIAGTQLYLYFTWINATIISGIPAYTLIQHRLQFNNTITVSNLIAQDERAIAIQPSLVAGSVTTWSIGMLVDYNDIIVYFPTKLAGVNHVYVSSYDVTDWFNMGTSNIDYRNENETSLIPFYTEFDVIGRITTSNFQSNELSTGTSTRIYYGLTPPATDYDITLTYTPADTYPKSLTSYQFTVITSLNTFPVSSTIIGLWDNVQSFSVSANGGQYQFLKTFTTSGIHIFTAKMYLNSINVYNETFTLTYIDGSAQGGTTEIMLPMAINLLVTFLPPFIMLVAPAVVLYEIMGQIGVLMGLGLGSVLGWTTGMIPQFLMWVIILCIVMYFVIEMKK